MTQLPEFLEPFRIAAERYKVGAIEFAGGTYQVQIFDAKLPTGEAWVFLQLDTRGQIKDHFCSCTEGFDYCPHLASAFLKIYNGANLPLHQRFENSLWNHLLRLFADKYGDDPSQLQQKAPGEWVLYSLKGESIFRIVGKSDATREKLEKLLYDRPLQTEETSLKFSDLSPEDLIRWRRGESSPQLKYELSFWCDLAHFLMRLQEEAQSQYSVQYEFGENKLPNKIKTAFSECEIEMALFSNDLPKIIPAFATIKSELAVHQFPSSAQSIYYDKQANVLHLEVKPSSEQRVLKKNALPVGDWLFIPHDGFYPLKPETPLGKSTFSGEEIATVLDTHFFEIQSLPKNFSLHLNPVPASHHLFFDTDWNLHIETYLFSPGDLLKKGSHYFKRWAFLDDATSEGAFYPIKEGRFSQALFLISKDEVERFIVQERSWLTTQRGFELHVASIESLLTYQLSHEGILTFFQQSLNKLEGEKRHEFGNWIYIAGKGFFSKTAAPPFLPPGRDLAIRSNQIPLIIRSHRSELESIPGFFSKKSPLQSSTLILKLTSSETIQVIPSYLPKPAYLDRQIRFFDEFTYVEGEGFHEIPESLKLPAHYQHPQEIEPDQIAHFIEKELPTLMPYLVDLDPVFIPATQFQLEAAEITADLSGYELKIGYRTNKGFIPLRDVWNAIRQKKRYLFSTIGMLDLSLHRFDWIRHIQKNQFDQRSNKLKFTPLEFIRLQASEEVTSSNPHVQQILEEYHEFKVTEEPDLTGLTSTLRHYQQLGVHWLWFLYRHGLSGLLCDEMGLGKTHQAMALLAAAQNHRAKQLNSEPHHYLVVCPTSVIYHWQEKLKEFLPNLRVLTFHGSDRSLHQFQEKYDLLLTSYGIWRRELNKKTTTSIPFEIAIFDEVQIAKNQQSRTHLSLRHIKAKTKIGLTGTPIENHLRELKSLFDLVLPSYMPKDADFRRLFINPIEKDKDNEVRRFLKRFIQPFVLRRKKIDVLPDLPAKVEELAHCELTPDQRDLYVQALYRAKSYLTEQLTAPNTPIPFIHIFALLTNLKQICNHPAAYFKTPLEYKKYSSGKWNLFIELLNEARESQQKVVVFSQYLAMLDLFAIYLKENGIEFATIRGATIDRGEQIRRFNQDPNCEVFIGSLHAAGLGIDLTAGSVVIHYDRWWNAARENQATDRVHRIGQMNPYVQVFKLMTRGTFEERINQLITEKATLMDEIVSSDDYRFLKQFSREEILKLLEDLQD